MAMASTFHLFPTLTYSLPSTTNPFKHFTTFSPPPPTRQPPLHVSASTSYSPLGVDYLETEFSGHGVSFSELGGDTVVKMKTENASAATLMLPSGLITSYKPHMWHGGSMEVLHTSVSEGEDGGAVVQGGVSVGLKCGVEGGKPWSPSAWSLLDVRGNPESSIEVELKCSDAQGVEVRNIITLYEDLLSSELVITNLGASVLQLMGSFVSHLTVSTPDATYAIGLQGSNYFSKPPLKSDFSFIPPGYGQRRTLGSPKSQSQTTLEGLLSKWIGTDYATGEKLEPGEETSEEEEEEEEDDNYAHLTDTMSRIYTSAPRRFTVIDRGRRNSVIVGRDGFDELYIFSPGSNYEWYGKYAYICLGPSALLKPVVLEPLGVWRGAQYLHNPNL